MRKETIGQATLYLGDCLTILPELRADAVITDPPYGQNFKSVSPSKLHAKNRGLNGVSWRPAKLNHGGRVYGDDVDFDPSHLLGLAPSVLIWGAHVFGHRLPRGQILVWDKRVDLPSDILGDAELAWRNKVGAVRIFRHRWKGLVIEPDTEETMRQADGVAMPRLHPTQKPVRVMAWSVGLASKNGDVVLDPYMGVGTTGVACMQSGRRFIGVEIEQKYFDLACERIENAQRQERLFA